MPYSLLCTEIGVLQQSNYLETAVSTSSKVMKNRLCIEGGGVPGNTAFLIRDLDEIRLGDVRSVLAQWESYVAEDTSAQAQHREQPAVPQMLGMTEFLRLALQIPPQCRPRLGVRRGGEAQTRLFTQAGQSQQQPAQSMVISQLIEPTDSLLDDQTHDGGICNAHFSHNHASASWTCQQNTLMMRNT